MHPCWCWPTSRTCPMPCLLPRCQRDWDSQTS
ncbi:hypothetical protein KIPB_016786, partial [Kipferlia bialata]|eukprot:g16786.t1